MTTDFDSVIRTADDAIASAMRRRRSAKLDAVGWGAAMVERGEAAVSAFRVAELLDIAAECRREPAAEGAA